VLVSLGVAADHVSIDRVRRIGRASKDGRGDESQLCGRCGTATAAVLPDGSVAPCPMAWWLSVGDVRNDSLSALIGERLPQLVRVRTAPRCAPSCGPNCNPMSGCVPWSACRPNG
jgi:MoaA/NifB/PqqE/SkfB family radical SAM enzyme